MVTGLVEAYHSVRIVIWQSSPLPHTNNNTAMVAVTTVINSDYNNTAMVIVTVTVIVITTIAITIIAVTIFTTMIMMDVRR